MLTSAILSPWVRMPSPESAERLRWVRDIAGLVRRSLETGLFRPLAVLAAVVQPYADSQSTSEKPMRPFVATLIALVTLVPGLSRAQETPTERDAARSVVRQLDSLERSLNVNAMV